MGRWMDRKLGVEILLAGTDDEGEFKIIADSEVKEIVKSLENSSDYRIQRHRTP